MTVKWDNINIKRNNGEVVKGKAPVIISASRSTDIPAFYSEWLIHRLKEGYAVWYNPFNRMPSFISFDNARLFVFWTKNPEPLIPYLNEFDKRKINYYFQYTLNDYEAEGFEPNLPKLNERIQTFKALSKRIGKEKVIWRFDPLIVTPQLTPSLLLQKIRRVGEEIKGYTSKLVFSFVDVKAYKKVQNNLTKELSYFDKNTVEHAELQKEQIHEIAEGLSQIKNIWKSEGWDVTIATCGEAINLEQYAIEKNKCIDDNLMRQKFEHDTKLMNFINYGSTKSRQYEMFLSKSPDSSGFPDMKDKGQRKECGCIYSKDIGMYNTCSHFCVYCYANTSKSMVQKNAKLHTISSESIIE